MTKKLRLILVSIAAAIATLSLSFGLAACSDPVEDDVDTTNVLSTAYAQPTKMPYYAEWLDKNYPRQKNVTISNEGLSAYPVFGKNFSTNGSQERSDVYVENMKLTSSFTSYYPTSTKNPYAVYNMMDKDGNLLNNKVDTGMDLYKHTAAEGMYFGNVSDAEPAVVKHFIFNGKSYGTVVTGLYAPAGEVVKVEMPASSLLNNNIYISIGQIFGSGTANVIGAGTTRSFVRMPVISNRFCMNKNTSYYDETTDTYTCYIGSHLGGPIYFLPGNSAGKLSTSEFDITVSGAVNYTHYIHGVTTEEEFEYVSKSSAPYFDLEVSWMQGVRHSGPLKYASMYNYEQLKNVADLWEKIGLISNQVSNWNRAAAGNIVFAYDDYVFRGSAVAVCGHRGVDAPYNWLTNSLNYEYFVTNGSWGALHEYNHHYQIFGLSGDSNEITNNAVNLLEYALFTKISSQRTLEGGLGGWNAYTMPQYGLEYIVEQSESEVKQTSLHLYAALLHNIGADAFLAACDNGTSANSGNYAKPRYYYEKLCDVTHLDMTWYFTELLHYTVADLGGDDVVNAVKAKNYPAFVPVNTVYQTGRIWEKDGEKQFCRTAQPFNYGNGDYTLDFENYLVIPKGFTYKIKSVTQPENGSVEMLDDKHVLFKPNDKIQSGEFFVTLEVKKNDNAFKVEDVTLIINLEQANILQRTTWSYTEENKPQVSSVDDLMNVYEALTPNDANATVGNNVNTAQNSNSEIWGAYATAPNSIMEVKGSLYINADGKYRIALRGRRYAALYLSYDGGKTYSDVIKLTFHESGAGFMPDDYVDVELESGSWVDFKAVLYNDYNGAYIGVGIGLYGADADGESTGETVSVSYASAYRDESFLPEPFFAPAHKIVTYGYTYKDAYSDGQTLVDSKYAYSVNDNPTYNLSVDYSLQNLFDEDENNVFWSTGNTFGDKSYSAENPFEITVDIGKTVTANTFTLYYPTASGFAQYYPTSFKLYAGTTVDGLTLVYETEESTKENNATVVKLEKSISLRYYKLEITDAANRPNDKQFALRKLEWSYSADGQIIAPNSKAVDCYEYGVTSMRDAVTYTGKWKNASYSDATFKAVYVGDSSSSASFEFVGTQVAVQSYYGSEYGSYEIYIDGKLVYTADLSDGSSVKFAYLSELLEDGKHAVTIKGKSGNFNLDSFVLFD